VGAPLQLAVPIRSPSGSLTTHLTKDICPLSWLEPRGNAISGPSESCLRDVLATLVGYTPCTRDCARKEMKPLFFVSHRPARPPHSI
jgi:hypothetical protein